MTRNTTLREKGQALFLAALMVLSVFAMSAAFAGAAVADSHDVDKTNLGGKLYFQGEEVVVSGFTNDSTVQLRSGDEDSSSFETNLQVENGEVTIDTSDLDGDYILRDESGTDYGPFEVTVQEVGFEFDDSAVRQGESTTLNFVDDNRGKEVDLIITAEREDHKDKKDDAEPETVSDEDLQSIFGENASAYEGDDEESVLIQNVSEGAELSAAFNDQEPGDYTFTISVADTTAEANASISVTDADVDANFDSSTYSQEAGDIVEFTVELEGAQSAQVDLVEDDDNYNVSLNVEDGDDDGEVTVLFNTYYAGQGEHEEAVKAADADDTVEIVQGSETNLQEEGNYRLLPADFTLELYVNNQEVDIATLVLNEQKSALGTATTGVAKHGADVSDAEAITEAAVARENVAEDDIAIVQVDASGIHGYLDVEGENAFDNETGLLSVNVEQTNPDRYKSPIEFNLTDSGVDYVQDAENDQVFIVIQTSETDADVKAGQEYDVTFNVSEDYSSAYDRDEESTSSSFSVEERSLTIDGVKDKEEHLVVEPSKEATISGHSNAAPGSEIRVRLRATGDDPFLLTQNVEVDEDGHYAATFDLSDKSEKQEFNVRVTDWHTNSWDEPVREEVTAKFGTHAEDPDTHSLTVSVVDEDGNAIPGASVTVDGDSATTNVKGQTAFDLADGEYTVSASADGYEDGDSKVTIDGDDADVTVTLTADEDKKGADDDDGSAGADDDSSADDSSAGDDDSTDGDEDQPGFGVIVALVALLAAAGLALRRQ